MVLRQPKEIAPEFAFVSCLGLRQVRTVGPSEAGLAENPRFSTAPALVLLACENKIQSDPAGSSGRGYPIYKDFGRLPSA
jgi:hypothetical protein